MSSPQTRPEWPPPQPPHVPAQQDQQEQEQPQPEQPQWDEAYVDPPTEPIPVVSDEPTQQWTMEPPPDADAPTQQWTLEPPPDADAPTQQWTLEPPPADPAPPPGPPPTEPPPVQPGPQEPPPPPPPPGHLRWLRVAAGVVILGALAAAAFLVLRTSGGSTARPEGRPPTAAAPTPAPVRGCKYPAQVLDLTGWNVTVPILGEVKPGDKDEKKAKEAKEVNQPDLATFADPPYFQVTPTCDSVAFRAPVNGVTTSGSSYPRSELREMVPDGSTTASWSSSVGSHTFVVNEAFTALPKGKPNLVGAQIHDAEDDVSVFRLEGSNLYVTEGNDTHYKLVTSSYVLGTRFEAKFVVFGDTIQAFYNGQLQTTISKKFDGAYFKAGAYTQANCEDSSVQCNSSTYGETTVYSLRVEHQ